MNKKIQPIIWAVSIVLLFLTANTAPALENSGETKPLTFSREDSYICMDIVKNILGNHYTGPQLDDAISSKIFDNYIQILDPSKHYFMRGEISRFKQFEHHIDDYLKTGDLLFAYKLFNLYLDRSRERYAFLSRLAESWEETFSFSKDETIAIDREAMPWCANRESLENLWRKELKNEILNLRLDDNSNDDISDTLEKTYRNKLNLLSQTGSGDAFQIFMNAVTKSLDPHTKYFAPRESEDFDIHMSQSLEGIGAVLQTENKYTKVVRLIPSGPADKSDKLMPGDKIIGVGEGRDGRIKNTEGLRIDSVVNLIRGPKDTVVRLKIIPAHSGKDSSKIISIKRDKVKLVEQSAKKKIEQVKKNGETYTIGIIEIPAFYRDFEAFYNNSDAYKSTTGDVADLISELEETGIDGLVIDLRNNGGGSLREAKLLTGLFIKTGPVVQIKARNAVSRLYDDDRKVAYRGPLVVLINRMSASASEIFAGAIKDYNRGIIVGTRSFGKGTVQSLQPVSKGKLKITSAKFYRVSGQSTQKKGIVPDISFPHIYNEKEVGESSLENAIPYDITGKISYNAYPHNLSPCIEELRKIHSKRADSDSGLLYLKNRIRLSNEMNSIKRLSLNEEKRRIKKAMFDRKQLELVNTYLQSIGKEMVKDMEDLEKTPVDTGDILMNETRHLTAAFIGIAQKNKLTW